MKNMSEIYEEDDSKFAHKCLMKRINKEIFNAKELWKKQMEKIHEEVKNIQALLIKHELILCDKIEFFYKTHIKNLENLKKNCSIIKDLPNFNNNHVNPVIEKAQWQIERDFNNLFKKITEETAIFKPSYLNDQITIGHISLYKDNVKLNNFKIQEKMLNTEGRIAKALNLKDNLFGLSYDKFEKKWNFIDLETELIKDNPSVCINPAIRLERNDLTKVNTLSILDFDNYLHDIFITRNFIYPYPNGMGYKYENVTIVKSTIFWLSASNIFSLNVNENERIFKLRIEIDKNSNFKDFLDDSLEGNIGLLISKEYLFIIRIESKQCIKYSQKSFFNEKQWIIGYKKVDFDKILFAFYSNEYDKITLKTFQRK